MKTHHGSCHCGAITYTVNANIEKAIECNCSHCARKGFILSFIPGEYVTVEGTENLTEYRFNSKHIAHSFCKTCGVQCFGNTKNADGKETYAINLRTIPDFDLKSITITQVDGKSR